MKNGKIAIVLGGGGAKGSYQAGVIKGLKENGLEITAITGTSVGALNGALTALNKIPEMIHLWESINEDNTFYPNYALYKTYGMIFKGSIYSNKWLKSNIQKYISADDLNSCSAWYGCVATDLNSGKSIFKHNGLGINLQNYILASASLPPAFPPVLQDGYNLVDGGLTSPLPVSEILEFSDVEYERIVIIPAGKIDIENSYPKNFLESNLKTIDILFQGVLERSIEKGLAKFWQKNKLFTLIQPLKNTVSTLECNHEKIMDFLEEGYIAGKNFTG